MTTSAPVYADLEVLISEEMMQARIEAMAAEINATYADTSELVLVCVLKGAFMFLSDLAKRLTVPCTMEFIRVSSYGDARTSSGQIKPVDLTLPNLNGKDVLLVEDIIDTGLTLSFFLDYLSSVHSPKSLRLAVMLDKKEARQKPVPVDFIGFEIGNDYVVGCGLDDAGFYRNLPHIARVIPA